MINKNEFKDTNKKLYVSDDELAVDNIYSKVQAFLTGHVYYINAYKDTQNSDAYRSEMYSKFLMHRAQVRHMIEHSGLTEQERNVMWAYYMGDDYANCKVCAQRTGYSEKDVAKLHASAFVKVTNRLQRSGKLK